MHYFETGVSISLFIFMVTSFVLVAISLLMPDAAVFLMGFMTALAGFTSYIIYNYIALQAEIDSYFQPFDDEEALRRNIPP